VPITNCHTSTYLLALCLVVFAKSLVLWCIHGYNYCTTHSLYCIQTRRRPDWLDCCNAISLNTWSQ